MFSFVHGKHQVLFIYLFCCSAVIIKNEMMESILEKKFSFQLCQILVSIMKDLWDFSVLK